MYSIQAICLMVHYASDVLCSVVSYASAGTKEGECVLNSGTHNSCSRFAIFCTWILGLLIGCILAFYGNIYTSISIRPVVLYRSSILSLFAVSTFPFFLSAWLAQSFHPFCIILVVLFKSLSYGFVSSLAFCIYNDAAWLAYALILFSSYSSTIIWFCFVLSNLQSVRNKFRTSFLIALCLLVLISTLDWFVISPLVVAIFS